MMIEPLNLSHVRETLELLVSGARQKLRRRMPHRDPVDPCGAPMFFRTAAINHLRHGRAVMATTAD